MSQQDGFSGIRRESTSPGWPRCSSRQPLGRQPLLKRRRDRARSSPPQQRSRRHRRWPHLSRMHRLCPSRHCAVLQHLGTAAALGYPAQASSTIISAANSGRQCPNADLGWSSNRHDTRLSDLEVYLACFPSNPSDPRKLGRICPSHILTDLECFEVHGAMGRRQAEAYQS